MNRKYILAAVMSLFLGSAASAQQAQGEAVPYSRAIPTAADYTPEKFKEVLESHGLSVEQSSPSQPAMIRIEAHGDMPDVWCPVTLSARNFERMVFTDPPSRRTLEQKLGIINQMTHPYYSAITVDMLESTQRFDLTPTAAALSELQEYRSAVSSEGHSPAYYFNNPAGEQERVQEREARTLRMFGMADKALADDAHAALQREPSAREREILGHFAEHLPVVPESVRIRLSQAVTAWGDAMFSNRQLADLALGKTVQCDGKAYSVDKVLSGYRPVCRQLQSSTAAANSNEIQR